MVRGGEGWGGVGKGREAGWGGEERGREEASINDIPGRVTEVQLLLFLEERE